MHDGTDSMTPLLQQFCNDDDDDYYNKTVTSSGGRLYVQFVSDDQFEAQGFAAHFRFIPRDRLTTSVAVTLSSYTSGTTHDEIIRLKENSPVLPVAAGLNKDGRRRKFSHVILPNTS